MTIVDKKEAEMLGLKCYFTGRPCKQGHVADRYVSSRNCVVCVEQRAKTDTFKLKQKDYCQDNKEAVAERKSRYNRKNRSRITEKAKQWKKNNPEKVSSAKKRYANRNRHVVVKMSAARRASKLKATPSWLSDEDNRNIGAIYAMAQRLSVCLGIVHHVDHIIPLRGKSVCGLHVPWNLRAIPGTANVKKSNKLLEDVQLI